MYSISTQAGGRIGYGGELAYNMPIESAAIGLRMHIHFNKNWFISPQVSYFPKLLNTHELFAGMNLNYIINPEHKWGVYPMVGAFYNRFINHDEYANAVAELDNLAPEFGLGVVKNSGCLRPFAEYRANPLWWESNIRIGILFYFGECFQKHICPAYTLNTK